ncbi:MAG: hypothetical protein AB1921_16530, partial [Thermodesulfobacteriota bacterium]
MKQLLLIKGILRGRGKTLSEKSCLSSPGGGCAARGPLFLPPPHPFPLFYAKLLESEPKAAIRGLLPIITVKIVFSGKAYTRGYLKNTKERHFAGEEGKPLLKKLAFSPSPAPP